jgi:V/A-type H+-transporting ATPase subunit C
MNPKNESTYEAEYAQAVGVLREIEKALLTREQWQRAIDASDIHEALRFMGADYGFAALGNPDAYEPLLQARLKETYEQFYQITPEPEVVDILNLKYVFHNLKVMVKADVSDHARQNSEGILSEVAKVTPAQIRQGEKGDAPEYAVTAYGEMREAYDATRDPQAIDMTGDRLMYAQMLILAESLQSDFILKYVQMSIDIYNLRLLVRAKNMQRGSRFLRDSLLPGGLTDPDFMKESYDKPFDAIAARCYYAYFGDAVRLSEESYERNKNFATLEKLTDNLLTAHIATAKYIAFGPEPLFAYLIARENEIRQIRIVITCKINGIDQDVLRERLRDLYG